MTSSSPAIGAPGGRTRLDLTLAVDADGNGLPDLWEKAVAAQLGLRWEAGLIRPEDAYPGAGLTYREVYLAGTYSVDPKEGFMLEILGVAEAQPRLTFTAVRGRTYVVQTAEEIGTWTEVPFVLSESAASASPVRSYHATETRRVEIRAVLPGESTSQARFFRLLVD
ncbi:MAG: hypothetical protein IT580_23485 [Verrucomicrobiales bacterium]|nr:hypothetical protein [Verrucomicrobiales bacterium]